MDHSMNKSANVMFSYPGVVGSDGRVNILTHTGIMRG